MKALTVLLAIIVFWLVNQIHLPASFGVKGLNSMNLLVILAVVMVFMTAPPPTSRPTPTPLKAPILFFFFALFYALIVGLLADRSALASDFTVFKTGVFYISLYFVFFHGVRDVGSIRLLVAAIMMVAALAGLEAMREALDYGLAAYSDTKRAAGPFGTDYSASNLAAVFFSIFLPLFVAVALYYKDRAWVRIGAMAGVGLLVFAIFFTYSRQAYAIVAIIGLLMALRKNLGIALILSVALWNYELWVPDTAIQRVQSTTQSSSSDFGKTELKVDESTASRFELWEGGMNMLGDRPLGIGLNHWKRQIGNYSQYSNLDAHNFYVLITAEAGLVGAVSIFWLITALFLMAISQIRQAKTPEAKTLAYGFMGATLALAMGNMYGSRFLNGEVVGNYWAFAALCARYFQLLRDGQITNETEDDLVAAGVRPVKARLGKVSPDMAMPGVRAASGRLLADDTALATEGQPASRPETKRASSDKKLRDQHGRLIRS